MVYEQFEDQQHQYESYEAEYAASACSYGATAASACRAGELLHELEPTGWRAPRRLSAASIQVPAYQQQPAFMCDQQQRRRQQQQQQQQGDWASIAEATMPLRTSELLRAAGKPLRSGATAGGAGSTGNLFQASIECRSRDISRKLVWVNLVSLLINLSLALVAFYFSFVNNSSSTSAFAADCVLDFISSAIVLWRYYGDLDSVYMQAREQIACIYLGALFEISAFGIIIKAASDIVSGSSPEEGAAGYDLIYLSIVATIACTILTVFKCSLYSTIRDKSILLDVINTLISTVFAMSIIMSQLLINVDSSLWYMDPILSIVLAVFMAGFGLKVLSQNLNILRPGNFGGPTTLAPWPVPKSQQHKGAAHPSPLAFTSNNYESNLLTSIDQSRSVASWQKSDYSTIAFV